MKALSKAKIKNHIPSYGKRGNHRSFLKSILVTFGCLIILIGLFILAIHIPAIFYRPDNTGLKLKSNKTYIKPDESGIRNMQEYVRDHQKEDFDNDGLINSDELKYSTDPRNPDTDKDGICDYAEVYIYNTRPGQKDTQLQTVVSERLSANNISVNAPYKIHDIIMWADDIRSRSAGTVIPTIHGYRFNNFNGWVQFPDKGYAYKYEDNIHEPLQYREKENAWRVESLDGDIEVVLYAEPLETIHLLSVFGKKYYVTNKTICDIFDVILPKDHSFITCKSIVKQDTFNIEIQATITEVVLPKFDKSDMSRFSKSTTEFEDLAKVYTAIKSGKTVGISLQSQQRGEVFGVIYGFTDFGDLMFADEFGNKTASDGTQYMINIKEKSAITIDQEGELRQREYFDYIGMGFDSEDGDKIYFMLN